MNARLHTRLVQAFLLFNSIFWLPWGLVCLVNPHAWSGAVIPGLDVYDLSTAVPRVEVRAMYGGLQMAVGIYALLGVFSARYRGPVLLFFGIALALLGGTRFLGMVIEGESSFLSWAAGGIAPGKYNQAGLAMYELPNMTLALLLLLFQPRRRAAVSPPPPVPPAENESSRGALRPQ